MFLTANETGSSALIASGTVLLALALLTNSLESVEGGRFKVQLRAVEEKLREASEADARGDVESADRIRLTGLTL